jgi:hypothetical protein
MHAIIATYTQKVSIDPPYWHDIIWLKYCERVTKHEKDKNKEYERIHQYMTEMSLDIEH